METARGSPAPAPASAHTSSLRLPPALAPPAACDVAARPAMRREIKFLMPPDHDSCPNALPIYDDDECGRAGGRLAAPRMSLLGKPLSYRATRRDARYRRLQSKIYNFLERPRGAKAVLYHMIVFLMVFMCLALSVFSTIDEYEVEAGVVLFYMETVVVVWFAIEFFLRLWSSGCRSRYQGSIGRLKFLRRPFCIIDVTTILASLVVLAMGSSGQVFAASALRGLRFFQILRMVRMDRRGGTWKLLGSVVYAHRQELITTLYIGFLGLIFASFLVYLAEKDVTNSKFNNFAQALWWGVITLCTVGYGDMVPQTWQGKFIASFCALLGISFFALPAGILGSGFALKVQQQQRQKHMIRRRQPAATLIQALWRCYAADEHSMSVATWKIHQVPLPSPPSVRALSSSFKNNASFVSRLPTIRRHKSTSLHSPAPHAGKPPAPHARRGHDINASAENLGVRHAHAHGGAGGARALNPSHSEDSVADAAVSKKYSDEDADARSRGRGGSGCSGGGEAGRRGEASLDVRRARAARAALRRHPTALRVGEASALPLALAGILPVSPASSLFACDTNEDDEPRCMALTPQHKAAIRFIRKLKYFLARKRFREALKPYDVKDVIEQYSSGHADLLNRTKNLQYRLDQILGKQGSKAKDVYASKISLASRVVKIERQVDDIESKLDHLLELYEEDRRRAMRASGGDPGGGVGGGEPGAGSGSAPALRPRPILVDKQFSEPNSPVGKSFPDQPQQLAPASAPPIPHKRPMNRGYSDLGNRVIRKKVTLRSVGSRNGSNGESPRDGEVVIVVPPAVCDDPQRHITDSSELCGSCSVEVEEGSSGSGSWVEGTETCAGGGEAGDGYASGSGESLAAEDSALLGPPAAAARIVPRAQRQDVAVDLHLLRPDV